eukprot:TRINITY_DN25746_c0_g1_i1.p2 TRINITY_DN25746_c0_g1~~TRINITY_DN25746_c0_g1_i1.p2  ORF type:complete len:116 (-),score=3.65 TRINITY_DN25746_c0_g1_i1:415-762(-)
MVQQHCLHQIRRAGGLQQTEHGEFLGTVSHHRQRLSLSAAHFLRKTDLQIPQRRRSRAAAGLPFQTRKELCQLRGQKRNAAPTTTAQKTGLRRWPAEGRRHTDGNSDADDPWGRT